MSSPNHPAFQFSVRRTRRSWSLSESDARTLTTVDEEEIFLFDDDDLKSKNHLGVFRKASSNSIDPSLNDLQSLNNFSMMMLGSPKSLENGFHAARKTETGIFHRRFNFYDCPSPGSQDLASSADSERSASISIEGLRDHLQSCFTCGVRWREDQASLDCHECGGYALERPCPDCNGNCSAIWTRDLTTTHQTRKAKWIGKCKRINGSSSIIASKQNSSFGGDCESESSSFTNGSMN